MAFLNSRVTEFVEEIKASGRPRLAVLIVYALLLIWAAVAFLLAFHLTQYFWPK